MMNDLHDSFQWIHPVDITMRLSISPDTLFVSAQEIITSGHVQAWMETMTSAQHFFLRFGAESMTFEIGDHNTPELMMKKGEISAIKFMELMLDN